MTKRVLAVLGDFYHKEELANQALDAAVQQLDQIKVEYGTVQNLVTSLQTKPDVVILFAENRLNPQEQVVNTWMDDAAAKAIHTYVSEGGGWIAWHSGLASYENIQEYTSLLRGYFKHHPEKHQIVTYYGDSIDSFEILDEHYFVHCDVDNTNVFLKSESVDGSSIAGWEHPVGEGRVVCLAPAHREEGLLHPTLVKLLANSIKSLLR